MPAHLHDSPDLGAAARHIELLTGHPDAPCHFRLLRGAGAGCNLSGKLGDLWPSIEKRQREGWQVFIVVNEGGHAAAAITRVRAVFVDGDGLPTPAVWHVAPDFIIRRDPQHWHAYWLVADLPVAAFKSAQRRLAAHYGTDPKVCDLPRIMRLAGTLHLKDPARPFLVMIEADGDARSPATARSAAELLADLPEISVTARPAAMPTGDPVSLDILRGMLGCIGPGCDRNQWRDTVAAIRAAPVPDDEGEAQRRAAAHDWSSGELAGSEPPANYVSDDDVDVVFDTMPPTGPGKPGIHFGSLVAKARGAGYDGPISIAEAVRIERWHTTIEQHLADEEQRQRAAAFCKGIAEASGGAIRPMPPPVARPPSPQFIEKAKAVIAEEKRRGDELARRWGLL